MDVVRKEIDQKIRDALNEFRRLRKRANVLRHFGMASSKRTKFRHKMRIRQEADVEDQVSVVRDAVLESEAHARNQNVPALFLLLKQLDYVRAQLVNIESRSVNDKVGHGANVPKMTALRCERSLNRGVRSQRVWTARLAIAPQQNRIGSFEEDDFRREHPPD